MKNIELQKNNMNLNKAFIIGRLTREPELKAMPSGGKVVSFGMASNRIWKNQDGEKQEAVEYHNVVAFGKQAELIAQYVGKGDLFFVEGRLQTRTWEDKDTGKNMYRTEIIVENMQFAPRGSNSGGESKKSDLDEMFPDEEKEGAPAPSSKKTFPKKTAPKSKDSGIEYPEEDINPEDIPF